MNSNNHKNTNGLLWAILGGIFSYVSFTLITEFTYMENTEEAIFAGTVILAIIICFCTGKLIDAINK
jgi:hypothetical protein